MDSKPPVILIHGLWLHSAAWHPWIELLRARGYDAQAPGWPGDGGSVAQTRENPAALADVGIDAVADSYRAIVASMAVPPILIGHSFGGLIAQKLLGEGYGAAAIGIDAAQIKGVLPLPLSALRSTLPVFRNPANRHHTVSLTAEQFRYSFGNELPEQESDALHAQWSIPAPGRPLFEAAAANFSLHSPAKVNTANPDRGPLLLIMGGRDHTVPEAITKATVHLYRDSPAVTELIEFEDRGHSLTMDHGWAEVAEACLTWLAQQGL